MNLNHKTIEHRLDNGLKVLFQQIPASPSATFMVWYKVGSKNEKPNKTGISHFLEHLSYKNTEFFNKGQMVAEITRNGGHYNAYTSRDFTAYFETFSTAKLELAMLIESQRMNKLIFDKADREKETGVILSELEKNLDNPYSALETVTRKEAYRHHPYGNPVIGWESDIKSITLDDLEEYYRKFYLPNNATIVIVGNFNENQTLELIKKYFGSIEPGIIIDDIPNETPQDGLRKTKIRKVGGTPIIKLAYHISKASNPDIFPLIVLGEMLNIGVSSRLNQSLVETEIATDISINVEVAKDPGLFTLMSTLFPKISHEEAEKRILEEISSISDGKPPTSEELKNIKRRINSSFEFNRDGTFKYAYLLGYYDTVDTYEYINTYTRNIEKVTINDIKRVAGKYLTPDNCSVGYYISSNEETKKLVPTYDYVPHETINHLYTDPPIILDEEIKSTPVKFTKKFFKNGLKVLISENKTSDTVKLIGTVMAGNIYSANVNPVLPVMCAGMLNRGSKGKTKLEIAAEIEKRGASVGISNVGEAVNFSLSCTSMDFPYILKILAEILMKPSFPEDEFEKYRHFSIAAIRQKKNVPAYIAGQAFSQMVFPKGHMLYVYPLSAQEKQVIEISLDDVKDFYENYYSPNTVILGISGNINTEEAFNLVEESFGNWEAKDTSKPIIRKVSLQNKFKEKIINVKNKTEAEVVFGHYGNLSRKSPDYHKAMVMNFILGGSGALSSRIGRRIREDLGLVYSICSSFGAFLIPGAWSVKFGIDTHYTDLATAALQEEIDKFIQYGINDQELDLAKSYLIGSYPLRFNNNSGIAGALLINEFYDLGDNYLNEYTSIISAITKEEINETAKKYLHPEFASVVKVGSFE